MIKFQKHDWLWFFCFGLTWVLYALAIIGNFKEIISLWFTIVPMFMFSYLSILTLIALRER